MDLENAKQMGQLQDRSRGFGKTVERKTRVEIARKLQAFDQRGHAGTVNIRNIQHIHNEMCYLLVAQLGNQGFANFGGIEKRNLARKIENRGVARQAHGNLQGWSL